MTNTIKLHDNCVKGETFPLTEAADLLSLGNKSVEQLYREHEGLLIFPQCLGDTDDKIDKEHIFDSSFDDSLENVTITTGNIMGFVGRGDTNMKIFSRFDDDDNDYLLHYMLQKVFSINLLDLTHTSDDESVFDLLIFMFPRFLKNALLQGVYRQYVSYQYNDARVKGAIDVARHIQRNIPFCGNIAYNTREYSRDNNVTELIRHTIEYIRTHKYGEIVLNMDVDTQKCVKEIIEVTPSYNKGQRNNIIQKNLRSASHPYYTDYIPLILLCHRILRWDEIKFGENTDEVNGILFDGAWLWEEYCNTILSKLGFSHPDNRKHIGGKFLFDNRMGPRYPDFIKENIVIDAKYKHYDKAKHPADVQRDDIHQLVTYMYMTQSQHGAFISPFQKRHEDHVSGALNGYGGDVTLFGINIPTEASSFDDFVKQMEDSEKQFEEQLSSYFEQSSQ